MYVQPLSARCDDPWTVGIITGVKSSHNYEVDNMPRHVNDLRCVPPGGADPAPVGGRFVGPLSSESSRSQLGELDELLENADAQAHDETADMIPVETFYSSPQHEVAGEQR